MADEGPKLIAPDGGLLSSKAKPKRDWTQVEFPIELFSDILALDRDDREQVTDGGIHLPDEAQTRSMTGTVVAVGPGLAKADGTCVPLGVAVGDRVVFGQMRRMIEVKVEGHVYFLTRGHDLLGRARGDVKIR
jgi:chaperonin GroES